MYLEGALEGGGLWGDWKMEKGNDHGKWKRIFQRWRKEVLTKRTDQSQAE